MDGPAPPRILALWSMPRSRSTAFFRMMAERGDFLAVHEPFSVLAEFGEVDVAGRRASSEAEVLAALRALATDRPVFFKDTADARYPAVLADADFLRTARHSVLVRHPAETIPSYFALNPEVGSDQIGTGHLTELVAAVRAAGGAEPVVLDAADLLPDPAPLVEAYCLRVGIPFRPEALSWAPGDRPEWRPTERWHADVSRTSGFENLPPSHSVDLAAHPHLAGYLDRHLPLYRELHVARLRPSGPG